MSKTVSLLACVALGGVLGFALSRAIPPPPDADVRSLAADQVASRAREILRGSDPQQRIAELSALLKNLGSEALPSLMEGFQTSPIDVGDPEGIVFAQWWASFDPKAAFTWATRDWRAGCGTVTAAVARIWARSNPQDALQHASNLRYPGQVEMAREAIWVGWDESGQPGLAEHLATGSMRDQQRLAQILARRRVLVLGIDGAIQWAQTFPDPAMRDLVAVRVASAAAAMSPEHARKVADWATPLIAAAKEPTGFPRRIGTRWIQHDPRGAMAWLSSLPAGIDRDDGVAESFRDWLVRDFDAAVAWIQEQTQGEIAPWAEPAISIFGKTNGVARPKETLELAARLQDRELRDSTSVIVLVHWMKRDRAAAEAWLAQSDLSPEVRKRVEVGLAAPRPPPGVPLMPTGPLGRDDPSVER